MYFYVELLCQEVDTQYKKKRSMIVPGQDILNHKTKKLKPQQTGFTHKCINIKLHEENLHTKIKTENKN